MFSVGRLREFFSVGRLTAFVAKSFHQARAYIFIDDKVLDRAIKWMVERQAADGSFPEPGRVIHTDMQVRELNTSTENAII